MRTMITSVVVSVLLGGFPGAAAQLPPEIMADSYLLQAEQLIAKQDYGGALDALNEIVALQREHNFTLPDAFHFKYAQVALGAGSSEAALESVTKYLATAGRDGEFYREALELMNKAQAEVEELKEQRERIARQEAREARPREVQKIRAALERNISTGIEFVRIPAGEFRMGLASPEADDDEQPVTQVRISRGLRSWQVRGYTGAVGGGDGEQPVIVRRMRIRLPGGGGVLGGCAGVHSETQRDGWGWSIPVADRGGVGVRGAGRDDRGSLWEPR